MTLIGLAEPPRPVATVAEWLSIPEDQGAELINGRLIYRAMPYVQHGSAQANVIGQLLPLQFPGGPDQPGWWFSLEVDLLLKDQGTRPDIAGWRIDKHPEPPEPEVIEGRKVITTAPEWICEVLSPSTADQDLGPKRDVYHRAGVGHYWLVDMEHEVLTILRWGQEGYTFLTAAGRNEVIRPEPFQSIDFKVAWLFYSKRRSPQQELTFKK